MMKKTILFGLVMCFVAIVGAQTSDSLGLFKQYDSLMSQYNAAKSNYDGKKEKYESLKTSAVDISSLSINGATEKSKAIAAAKLEKEKAGLELSAKKKAVVEIADKANKVYQEKLNASNSALQNYGQTVKAKQAAVKGLQAKQAKAKGKVKASLAKELSTEKSNLDSALKKQEEAKKSFEAADANAKKTAENLKAANSLVTE